MGAVISKTISFTAQKTAQVCGADIFKDLFST